MLYVFLYKVTFDKKEEIGILRYILFILKYLLFTKLDLENLLGMRLYQINHNNAIYKPQLCFSGMYITCRLLM